MGELKSSKWARKGLISSEIDASSVQPHIPSPGELLVKELVKKQTKTDTSLDEQLRSTKEFVHAGSSASSYITNDPLTLDQLRDKTGLSREELETNLSVKPNSHLSKLYKFAISNSSALAQPASLEDQLPDHPIHQLKVLEDQLMKDVSEGKCSNQVEKVIKKKKHRGKRKKKAVVQGCEAGPKFVKVEKGSSVSRLSERDAFERSRPSLWDVEDMSSVQKSYGCRPSRKFTIREGEIVEVSEDVVKN